MDSLYSFIILMFAAAFCVGIAQKVHVAYPIALVIAGTILGFIPGLPSISFDPNLLLVIVLPPILYSSSFGISFREFKANWREIFSLALGLVFLTTLVIGLIFKWLFPEFSWALAFTFGAIISPPDAIAATAILRRFPMSSRLLTILEGESLVNDASALVLYRLGTTALLTGIFSLTDASIEFFKIVIGGIAVGLVLGFIIQRFSRRYLGPVVGVVLSITIPYVTYILADSLGVSGVLAVVTNGLVGSLTILSHPAPLRRILGFVMWDIYSILLNCFIFILIGLQLKLLVSEMSLNEIIRNAGYGVLITFCLIVVRMIWVYTKSLIYYFHLRKDLESDASGSESIREAALVGWSGMRGIVSLTAAMALPLTLPNGIELAGREEVIFITFVVILSTLLMTGLTLPLLIHWLNLNYSEGGGNEHHVRKELMKVVQEKIGLLHVAHVVTDTEAKFLSNYFKIQHEALEISASSHKKLQDLENLRLELIREQRKRLLEIWKRGKISDKELSQLEHELDLEEIRLARAELK